VTLFSPILSPITVMKRFFARLPLILMLASVLGGCAGAYHRALEQRGMTKRDILVRRIQHVQSAQYEAKLQFTSAQDSLRTIAQVEPGRLREKHAELDAQLKNGRERARDLQQRLPNVDSAAESLFKEWAKELALYQNAALRERSEERLSQTRARYGEFMAAQRAITAQIAPVLRNLSDQVLLIKHGLNVQAHSENKRALRELQEQISELIRAIDNSNRSADAFIESLNTLD